MENKKKKQTKEKLNIYLLWIEESGYEEYDGFVVISKDLESAKKFILSEYDKDFCLCSWKRKEVKNRYIGTSYLEEQVVLESYIHG